MLIAILIGNNIVNILAASLATVIAINLAGSEGGTAVTIATVVVTLLVLLFGEIFPKTFASRYAERISLAIAPIYLVLIKLFYPIILIIERMMKLLNKHEKKQAISSSDLEAFIELSKDSGIFDNDEDKKIKKLISLDELTAEDVMTPRIKLKAIEDSKTLDEAIQILT